MAVSSEAQLANVPPKLHERANREREHRFDSSAFHDRTRRRLLAGTMRPERVSPCLASRRIRELLRASRPSPRTPQRIRPLCRALHPFARPFLGPRVDESRVQLLARSRARRSGARDRDACDRRQPRMERNETPTFFRSIVDESRFPVWRGERWSHALHDACDRFETAEPRASSVVFSIHRARRFSLPPFRRVSLLHSRPASETALFAPLRERNALPSASETASVEFPA